jgi:hypothetical protein
MIRLAIALAILASSCGGGGGATGPCLILRQQSLATMAPARVQLFFTVDTCQNTPVTDLEIGHIEIRENGSRISPLESQQRLVRQPLLFRSYSMLVLDLSASIIRGDQLQPVQAAATDFARTLLTQGPEHHVGVFTFDGRRRLSMVQSFTADLATLETAIARISNRECTTSAECTEPDHNSCVEGSGTGLCLDDSTNLYGAIVEAISTLTTTVTAAEVPFKIGSLVLFTDGRDQAAYVTRAEAIDQARRTAHNVFTVGVGPEADTVLLQVVGKSGSVSVSSAGELGQALIQIGEDIRQQAGRHYLLEYCSPKRSGTHELLVTVNDEGAIGDLRATFNATGFTSGCTLN